MKYRLQILTIFAIVTVLFLSARGLAKKTDIVVMADITDATSLMLSANSGIATTGTIPLSAGAENAILGEANSPSLKPAFFRQANSPSPETSAEASLIFDVQSGEKYFDLASGNRWPTASLTKLLTAAIVYEKMDLDSTVTIDEKDFADGDNPVFAAGESYRLRDLLKVMLVASRNTIANAFARVYGHDAFISLMNEKAKEWGMDNSHFDDPSGLSVANQSSAQDLMKLIRGVTTERPDIWKTTENATVTIREINTGKGKTFTSTNQFVSRKDFYGGKTGYTPEADGNLISIFLYGKRTLGIIVLGSADRFGDSERLYNWFTNDFKPSN